MNSQVAQQSWSKRLWLLLNRRAWWHGAESECSTVSAPSVASLSFTTMATSKPVLGKETQVIEASYIQKFTNVWVGILIHHLGDNAGLDIFSELSVILRFCQHLSL